MQSTCRSFALLCLVLGPFGLSTAVAVADTPKKLATEQWREDLAALDLAIRTDHKSPFHTVSEVDYTDLVNRLHESIPVASDQQIIVQMAAIVAAINDGHTRLQGWHRNADWGFHSYPIGLYWFDDGLYVRQAHPDYADWVGARVLRIGEYTADEAQVMIERVVAADNAHGERFGGPFYLISPEVMQALGIIDEGDSKPYLLEKDGVSFSPEIEPLEGGWPGWTRGFVSSESWLDAKDGAESLAPLWRRHPEKAFWMEVLPEHRTLYVQQNQVLDGHDETLEAFYARVWEAFEQNDVSKLVLDVRLNGGGNNYLNRPAVTTMVRADASAQTFTVIGRQTFSACQNLVNELSRWTNTVFVGEPTGERVNFYGDTKTTVLPHSGLTVRASWLWWQNLDPRDTRDALYPDLAADLSFADYAANRDPAMTAILEFEGVLTVDAMVALIDEVGTEAAAPRIREAIGQPIYRHRDMESEINILGYRLMSEQRLDEAIAVFTLNAEEFADSWNVYDSLGEAHEVRGELERALELFQKSLALNPESATGLAAVARLQEGIGASSGQVD